MNLTLKAVRLLAGVITEQQGKSVSQLLATEVVSLQELVCNEFVSSVAKIIGSCEEILQAVVGGLTYKNDENFGTFQKHLLLKTHENSNGGRFRPQRPVKRSHSTLNFTH